jgi:catechol 2,3-dioxygenase-like lactoylglutathione lyase family enzyme
MCQFLAGEGGADFLQGILKNLALAGLMFGILLGARCVDASENQVEAQGPSMVGIDHIPLAVRSLEDASDAYRRLGFALKPGRLHGDGIRNVHVKFKDGSGIELLCPPAEPVDTLTRFYRDFLRNGDGPAYLSLHARDSSKLLAALAAAAIQYRQSDIIELEDPGLDFLFIVEDNRSPTDRPEHFRHPDSAIALRGVWLALEEPSRASLEKLLLALGAAESKETVSIPVPTEATVFAIQNGRIVVVSASHALVLGRPIIGAEFRVRDIAVAESYLHSASEASGLSKGLSVQRQILVAPSQSHGLWLDFSAD